MSVDRVTSRTHTSENSIRVGVLGFGGLGQAATRVLAPKQEMLWVAAADRLGYAYDPVGLNPDSCIATYTQQGSVGYVESCGVVCDRSIASLVEQATSVDAYFLALPNLPNTFMAEVAQQFIQSGWRGVLVDALKRTSAVEQLLAIQTQLQTAGITYMTGCGATPGLLTAAAALAAQSYAEIHSVKITFGVGIANWEAYRATIREDIAHMPGYDVDKAQADERYRGGSPTRSNQRNSRVGKYGTRRRYYSGVSGNRSSRSGLGRGNRRYPKSQKTPQHQRASDGTNF